MYIWAVCLQGRMFKSYCTYFIWLCCISSAHSAHIQPLRLQPLFENVSYKSWPSFKDLSFSFVLPQWLDLLWEALEPGLRGEKWNEDYIIQEGKYCLALAFKDCSLLILILLDSVLLLHTIHAIILFSTNQFAARPIVLLDTQKETALKREIFGREMSQSQ